jgi:peptidoglycan/xylan/chitin deacetylase (PgdA/CDA1 family)
MRLNLTDKLRRKARSGSDLAGGIIQRYVSGRAARCFYQAAVILIYHRIARRTFDPFDLAVSPERFAEQLAVLRRWGHPIRLEDLPGMMANGTVPRRAYVITFDDGYADNLLNAKPLLERHETPATVFAAAEYAPGGRRYWWEVVDQLLAKVATKRVMLRIGTEEIEASQRGDVHRRLAVSKRQEVDAVISELTVQAGVDPCFEPEDLPMTESQLRDLSASGLIDIGSHGTTHRRLAALSEKEQREEIVGAKQLLEQVLGRPVRTFAYPFGVLGSDYTELTQSIVQQAGHTCACAVFPNPVRRPQGLYGLPRCWVSDWDGDELERRLRSWYVR